MISHQLASVASRLFVHLNHSLCKHSWTQYWRIGQILMALANGTIQLNSKWAMEMLSLKTFPIHSVSIASTKYL